MFCVLCFVLCTLCFVLCAVLVRAFDVLLCACFVRLFFNEPFLMCLFYGVPFFGVPFFWCAF